MASRVFTPFIYVCSLCHLELLDLRPISPAHIEKVCEVCESYPSLILWECSLSASGVLDLVFIRVLQGTCYFWFLPTPRQIDEGLGDLSSDFLLGGSF